MSGPLTDGIHAELIRSDSGLLLGIRVSWSWLSWTSDPVQCFQSPTVELIPDTGNTILRTLDSTSHSNLVEFNNITELDCNEVYFPRVRATLTSTNVRLFDNGNDIFFGGILNTMLQ